MKEERTEINWILFFNFLANDLNEFLRIYEFVHLWLGFSMMKIAFMRRGTRNTQANLCMNNRDGFLSLRSASRKNELCYLFISIVQRFFFFFGFVGRWELEESKKNIIYFEVVMKNEWIWIYFVHVLWCQIQKSICLCQRHDIISVCSVIFSAFEAYKTLRKMWKKIEISNWNETEPNQTNIHIFNIIETATTRGWKCFEMTSWKHKTKEKKCPKYVLRFFINLFVVGFHSA